MLHLAKKDARMRKKQEDTVVRWKCCLFFWCVFLADSVAAQAVCSQASRRLFKTVSESMPELDLKGYVSGLISQNESFPNLVSEGLKHHPVGVIEDQIELMEWLKISPEFQRLLKQRDDLLTLRISNAERSGSVTREVLDGEFVQRWGASLADSVSDQRLLQARGGSDQASSVFLKEMEEILKSPQGRINADSLVTALTSTIESINGNLRREIAEGVALGDISLLRRHLPEALEATSFNPARLGMEVGEDREYYLTFLENSIQSGKKLDQQLVTYIFSKHVPQDDTLGEFLRDMHEGVLDHIKDAHSKNTHIQEVLAHLPARQHRFLKRFLKGRLDKIWKEISGHKKTITETADAENTSLTLTEVHPYHGIFRGNLGGDCSTSHSFGFANSPMEKVFFITNKKGQDVGYVTGSKVSLPDGQSAFLINTVAGARVSGIMTENILSALARSKSALGVDEVVIIGEQNLEDNINYEIIRGVYRKFLGNPVKVTFHDKETREIIGNVSNFFAYDSVFVLENARYLKLPDTEVSVHVERRPFALSGGEGVAPLTGAQKLMVAAYSPSMALDLNITISSIFPGEILPDLLENVGRAKVAQYKETMAKVSTFFGIEEEEMLEVLKADYLLGMTKAADTFDSQNVEEILALMEKLKKSLNTKDLSIIFKRALVYKADPQVLGKLAERMPQKIGAENFSSMFESALEYQADSQILGKVMEWMPGEIDAGKFSSMFRSALKYQADSQTLSKVMERMPQRFYLRQFPYMFESALKYKADPQILGKIMERLPLEIDANDFLYIFRKTLEYQADPQVLGKLAERMPREIDAENFASIFESALKYQADPQILGKIMERLPLEIDATNFLYIFKKTLEYKADPQALEELIERIPELELYNWHIENFIAKAEEYEADPEIIRKLEELLY